MVYNDHFEMVVAERDVVPPNWPEMVLHSRDQIIFDKGQMVELDEKWLNNEELQVHKERETSQCQNV